MSHFFYTPPPRFPFLSHAPCPRQNGDAFLNYLRVFPLYADANPQRGPCHYLGILDDHLERRRGHANGASEQAAPPPSVAVARDAAMSS